MSGMSGEQGQTYYGVPVRYAYLAVWLTRLPLP